MPAAPRVPLAFERLPEAEMRARASAILEEARRRRTVREFSREPIPLDVVEAAIAVAGTAPSGANRQPWTFVLVTDPELKRRIRAAAEEEERLSYEGRMPDEWLRALEPLGTDASKPHLQDAPALIVVFEHAYALRADGVKEKHYYVRESVGIAVGFLLAALHASGLATLTHTPSPMRFLAELLERPPNERAYVLVPVGYPAAAATVPALEKKPLEEILVRR
jgi:iodotyrosine deiodinase